VSTGGGFTTIDYPKATTPTLPAATRQATRWDAIRLGGSEPWLPSVERQFTIIDYPGATFTGPTAIDPAGDITGAARQRRESWVPADDD